MDRYQVNRNDFVTEEFLLSVFTNKKFRDHLIYIGNYGQRYLSEAGFVVQNRNNTPYVSRILRARKSGSYEDQYLSYSLPSLDFLAKTGKKGTKRGTNIIITIHCHPKEENETVQQILRPSLGDLSSWEITRVKANNPYSIEGIVVKDKEDIWLLLIQQDPTREQNAYYVRYDHSQPVSTLFKLLEESGIRFETLKVQTKTKQFSAEELEKLKKFVVDRHTVKKS